MKRLVPALGLALCCTATYAQSGMAQGPTPDQAKTALQNAMTREVQTLNANPAPGFDGPEVSNMVSTMQVKDVDNCQPSGPQSVRCDVSTVARVRGNVEEHTHRYEFFQEGGRWQARLPPAS